MQRKLIDFQSFKVSIVHVDCMMQKSSDCVELSLHEDLIHEFLVSTKMSQVKVNIKTLNF